MKRGSANARKSCPLCLKEKLEIFRSGNKIDKRIIMPLYFATLIYIVPVLFYSNVIITLPDLEIVIHVYSEFLQFYYDYVQNIIVSINVFLRNK